MTAINTTADGTCLSAMVTGADLLTSVDVGKWVVVCFGSAAFAGWLVDVGPGCCELTTGDGSEVRVLLDGAIAVELSDTEP